MNTTPRTKEREVKSLLNSPRNAEKAERAVIALTEALEATLKQGFFGTVTLERAVQDGTIQHLRKRVEELER
mgnify:CR=1 FL=1